MSEERDLRCGFVEEKSFNWGDKLTINFRESDLAKLKSYMTGGNDKYEASVKIEIKTSKAGNKFSVVDTYFYDKANGTGSGSTNSNQSTPVATPSEDDLPF